MPIKDYKGNFEATVSFISVDQDDGGMDIAFQIRLPGFNYDLAHPGRDKSHGYMFLTTYNTEEAHTLLEVNSAKRDKDFLTVIDWKKEEEYVKQGKGRIEKARSEEHTSELQSRGHLVCRLLL